MPRLYLPLIKLDIIRIRVRFWELQVKVKNCAVKDAMLSRIQITNMKLHRLTASWSCRFLRFKVDCGHVIVGVAVRAAMFPQSQHRGLEWRSLSFVQMQQRYLTGGPFSLLESLMFRGVIGAKRWVQRTSGVWWVLLFGSPTGCVAWNTWFIGVKGTKLEVVLFPQQPEEPVWILTMVAVIYVNDLQIGQQLRLEAYHMISRGKATDNLFISSNASLQQHALSQLH